MLDAHLQNSTLTRAQQHMTRGDVPWMFPPEGSLTLSPREVQCPVTGYIVWKGREDVHTTRYAERTPL